MIKISVLFVLFLCLLNPLARAEVVLDKGKIAIKVKPGETVKGSLTLTNNSAVDIPLRAYYEDFTYVAPFDGSKNFLPAGSTDYSCGDWISYSPQEFILSASSKQELNYVIKVPENARGGYYGVLFFEKSPKLAPKEIGLGIIVRVGCLFFIETEDRLKKSELESISAEDNMLKADFTNTGNTVLIGRAIYYTMDARGMVVDRSETEKFYLPIKGKYPLSIAMPEKLSVGRYTIILTFDLEEGDVLVKEIDFTKNQRGSLNILQIRD